MRTSLRHAIVCLSLVATAGCVAKTSTDTVCQRLDADVVTSAIGKPSESGLASSSGNVCTYRFGDDRDLEVRTRAVDLGSLDDAGSVQKTVPAVEPFPGRESNGFSWSGPAASGAELSTEAERLSVTITGVDANRTDAVRLLGLLVESK